MYSIVWDEKHRRNTGGGVVSIVIFKKICKNDAGWAYLKKSKIPQIQKYFRFQTFGVWDMQPVQVTQAVISLFSGIPVPDCL